MPNQLNRTAPLSFNNEHKFIKVKLSNIEAEMKSLESKFLNKALNLADDLSCLKKHCLENNIEYTRKYNACKTPRRLLLHKIICEHLYELVITI